MNIANYDSSKLRHQNILLFLGACLEKPHICLIAEFIQNGSLCDVMKRERLSFGRKLTIAIETIKALMYLHSQNPPILHRDLKTANLLVDENYHIKVADFGLSKPAEDNNTTASSEDDSKTGESETTEFDSSKETTESGGGTLYCMAPEAFHQTYTKESDVYSFGIILYELFTETIPYEGMSQMQIIRSIEEGNPLTLPSDIDEDIGEIINACLNRDMEKRPSLDYMMDKLKSVKTKYLKMSEGIESSY